MNKTCGVMWSFHCVSIIVCGSGLTQEETGMVSGSVVLEIDVLDESYGVMFIKTIVRV